MKAPDYNFRPEPGLKLEAAKMLDIVFHHAATTEEVDMARSTLLEIIAPETLQVVIDTTTRQSNEGKGR